MLWIVILGTSFALARSLYLAFNSASSNASTDWLKRVLTGAPYYAFRYFGLDMWGFILGIGIFALFVTFGFFACACYNCFGRARVVQPIFRRRRDAMPFMDMVSNRFTLFS